MLPDQKCQQSNSIRNLLILKNEDQEIILYMFKASIIGMDLWIKAFYSCSWPLSILWNKVKYMDRNIMI